MLVRQNKKHKIMEGRFKFGYCLRLIGPSQCGKTVAVLNLLERPHFFDHCPGRIMWISGSGGSQDRVLENKIKNMYPNSRFFDEIPENLTSLVRERDIWVFDDVSIELRNNSHFTNFFTKTAHHKKCFMMYLTQNAFESGKDSTSRARNCAYQFIFNNRNDVRQLSLLSGRLTGNTQCLQKIMSKLDYYDFLLVDNTTSNPKNETFWSGIFSKTPTVYVINCLGFEEENI